MVPAHQLARIAEEREMSGPMAQLRLNASGVLVQVSRSRAARGREAIGGELTTRTIGGTLLRIADEKGRPSMPAAKKLSSTLETGHYRRRRATELQDPAFREAYEQARTEIAQVDAVMRQLDALREASGVTKVELARLIGRNPSTVRRLFTAEVNPELKTVAAIATALGARLEVSAGAKRAPRTRKARSARSVA
jgi:DNA-binding phage protein